MAKTSTQRLVRDLEEAIEAVTHEVKRGAQHLGRDAEDEIGAALEKAGEAGRRLAAEAQRRGEVIARVATREVRAHPFAAAAAVAAVAGLILVLATRRDHR